MTPNLRGRRPARAATRAWARALSSVAVALAACAAAPDARAVPVWVGDLESGDLSQWDGALNGEHIAVVPSPVAEGAFAAQIQLTNDAVWPNGLKRVELHHSPAPGRTAEGAETYFAWSFMVPETLPTDPAQEIGYWESDQSYQQVMAFDVDGEHIAFATRKPQNAVHWEADGKVTAGVWHRIALHVRWSKDAAQGSVDVWFDGEQVVAAGPAATLADDNPHFTQVGLLRGAVEFQDAPILYVDDAVEGDTLDDVHPDALSTSQGGGGAGGAGTGAGGATGAGGGATGQGGAGGGAASTSGAGASAPPEEGDDGGCGCRAAPSRWATAPIAIGALLAGLVLARRRRRR